MGARSSVG